MNEKNSCYTYFKIVGNFMPDEITKILKLNPTKQWSIGDLRRNSSVYDFALWEYGRCDKYDGLVENQMMNTIKNLIPKSKELNEIKKAYDVDYTLEVVPTIYVGETTPSLSPNRQIMEFCCDTGTEIDIDLYVYDS